MSAPDKDPDTLSPPSRPDTLREVDWVSLAPWLELLQTPRRALGYGFLLGAIGAVLLGGVPSGAPSALVDLRGLPAAAWEGVVSPVVAVRDAFVAPDGSERGWSGFATGLVKLAAWAWLGLVIARRAAVGVGDGLDEGLLRSLFRSLGHAPRLAAVLGLGAAPVGVVLFGVLPRVIHAGLNDDWVAQLVALGWVVWLVAALVAAVLSLGLVIGAPLLWAAIAVDDADAFDAVSRMFAYVYQRLARLAFYVAVLAACGVAAGMVVELLAAATLATAHLGTPADLQGMPLRTLGWWEGVFLRALRGFYPAYFFTAAVTLYLQLRRDIDGQPTDEVARGSE